jgi:dolichol-phosphate mannosyltransferase
VRVSPFRLDSRLTRQFLSFGAVGVIGTGVNTGVLFLLHSVGGMHYLPAAALAAETAIISNFIGNDNFTFRHAGNRASAWRRFLSYNLISLTTLAGTLLLLWTQVQLFGTTLVLLWNLIAIGTMFLANFAINRAVTWRHHGASA